MCEECSPTGPDGSKPRMSRRVFLAVAAVAGGAVAGLYSSCQPPKGTTGTLPTTMGATGSGPATAVAASAPESAPSTAVASAPAITSPAPDLGMEIFPDSAGQAIAKGTDAPVLIIPRTAWTNQTPHLGEIVLMNGIDKITVHHTAGNMTTDAWNPTARTLEGIRGFHAGTAASDRQWADIAYHFAVDRAGRVWQARPLVYQGAHVKGHNEHNLGIVLLGDFEAQTPSAAQLWSLSAFIGFLRPLYKVSLDNVFTHGELGKTSCPGKALQAFMTRERKTWATAEGIAWEPKRG